MVGEGKIAFLQLSPGQGKFGHPLPGLCDPSVGTNQCNIIFLPFPRRKENDRRLFLHLLNLIFSTQPGFLQTPLPLFFPLLCLCGKNPPSRKISVLLPPEAAAGNAAQEERAPAVKGIFRESAEHHLVKAGEGTISVLESQNHVIL